MSADTVSQTESSASVASVDGNEAPSSPTSSPERGTGQHVLVTMLTVLSLIWIIPLLFILINSFKGKFYI